MKDALRLLKVYISDEIERFSLTIFCLSQRQNPRTRKCENKPFAGNWNVQISYRPEAAVSSKHFTVRHEP